MYAVLNSFTLFIMPTFKIYSKGCPTCMGAMEALQSAIDKRGCDCPIEEITCDGACSAAKEHNFTTEDLPVIERDGEVIHKGALTAEQAETLLPAKA